MEKLDKGTYGSSIAAIRLAEMLSKIHGRMGKGFESLARMTVDCKEDRDNRETLMQLWRDAKIQEAEKTKTLPPVIASHLVNLIVAKYRVSKKVANWMDDTGINSTRKDEDES